VDHNALFLNVSMYQLDLMLVLVMERVLDLIHANVKKDGVEVHVMNKLVKKDLNW
jgi:hypothetical protein